ncbi:MAG: bifunctional glutamate N-acetyltransferase/amino-acid acetyltransferase ArgJ, partial [Anaerolineae bacterium]|nr:bifunctional glutamate N-acetyltransferase/amino-acid acetyltransferase ArgJ [Anaerolineae bacterium]
MVEVKSTIEHVDGFRVAGVHCGLKKNGKLDFALIVSDVPCTAAGVFTTNTVKAAPVLFDMERLKEHNAHIRAVAINSGCANACTGQQGMYKAWQTARWVAEKLNCSENEVLLMSTGVIGAQLNMYAMRQGIDIAMPFLGHEWLTAARAIMTTDTRPKLGSVQVTREDGSRYVIAGMCKGAGMIAPDMATMLSAIITDAGISVQLAQRALAAAADQSFNRIVVDGDMSTNDTVLLLANGESGAQIETAADFAEFVEALGALCRKLAQEIVRDGEGATKFITISVQGAPDDASARQIANAIATSPLVKTAFYGNDANWGRIIAAAGRSGVAVKPDLMQLWIAPGEANDEKGISLQLFAGGIPVEYSEDVATNIIKEKSVSIVLDCGIGSGAAVVWTCDLSHDYVDINGSYRS